MSEEVKKQMETELKCTRTKTDFNGIGIPENQSTRAGIDEDLVCYKSLSDDDRAAYLVQQSVDYHTTVIPAKAGIYHAVNSNLRGSNVEGSGMVFTA